MPEIWKTRSKTRVQQTPVFAVDLVKREPPWDPGAEATFFVVDLQSWVNVFAYTDDDRLVLIRQFRHGTEAITLEVPGGIIDDDESPMEAAIRELREETGYEARAWQQVGVVDVNPAIQTNRCYTFVALGAHLAGETAPDEHEDIEVVTVPAASLSDLITSGQITHSLVVAGAFSVHQWLRHRDRDE